LAGYWRIKMAEISHDSGKPSQLLIDALELENQFKQTTGKNVAALTYLTTTESRYLTLEVLNKQSADLVGRDERLRELAVDYHLGLGIVEENSQYKQAVAVGKSVEQRIEQLGREMN
jgi:hypothetical protein